ncbi:MAG: transporter substrate-binding domain-containing protein [Oribacterium sp.]|nr:transporter substrate-binding domain-containing protein [Oribacterium sp.]MBO6309999.1 transporter substrate-binding domain-containing protein [Oribacterium sp.]MBP3277545.1 transporter substrate-binding domain-containing protein [Butyrivibrio sp.]MBP3806416.1 transporter substrate-binding domain-containing protein [Oribacterium sp.]
MKKNLSIIMAAVLAAASLAGCGSSKPAGTTAAATTAAATEASSTEAATEAAAETTAAAEESKTDVAAQGSGEIAEIPTDFTTITPGKLTIGTSPDFAPYEFYHINDGTPELAGFDIALAQRIADDLGLELQVVPMDFDGILMELQNGNIDLGISGFTPTPERAQTFDFSDLYYTGGQAFVIRGADSDKYKDYADFDGLPVGAQNGSIQMDLAQKNTPNANIIGLAKVTDIIPELVSGKLEGAFIETPVAEQYIKNYPELKIAWDVEYDTEGYAIALKKGSDLLPAVNAVVNNVLSDGSMDEYITTAQELASDDGNVFEGQLDENGQAAAN